jgi:hypothetical protein
MAFWISIWSRILSRLKRGTLINGMMLTPGLSSEKKELSDLAVIPRTPLSRKTG